MLDKLCFTKETLKRRLRSFRKGKNTSVPFNACSILRTHHRSNDLAYVILLSCIQEGECNGERAEERYLFSFFFYLNFLKIKFNVIDI